MVDFIELEVLEPFASMLRTNEKLDFQMKVSRRTGTKADREEAEFHGLTIIIYDSGRTVIKGSLHKYRNEGWHNADQFTFNDLQIVIKQLELELGIQSDKCLIHQIEFGVNMVDLYYSIQKLLDGLIFHKGRMFSASSGGLYRQCEHQRYIVKVYDKGRLSRHYNSPVDVFRFEMKIRKMIHISGVGISYLSDLCTDKWIALVGKMLVMEWNEILFFDSTLNDDSANSFKWSNPIYWKNLSRQKRHIERKKFNNATKLNSDHVQNYIANEIELCWNRLTN